MKVVTFNGSARKDGNTAILIETVLTELQKEGIDTQIANLADMDLRGCTACYKCFDNKNKRCVYNKDGLNDCIEAMLGADAIIIGSPTYFANVSTEVKALIDRSGLVAKANDDMFKRKVGAAVVAVRRAGSLPTFDAINHFFFISQMIVPGSNYWNMGIGREKEDVKQDEEGLQTMKILGENMAWLMKRIVENKGE